MRGAHQRRMYDNHKPANAQETGKSDLLLSTLFHPFPVLQDQKVPTAGFVISVRNLSSSSYPPGTYILEGAGKEDEG